MTLVWVGIKAVEDFFDIKEIIKVKFYGWKKWKNNYLNFPRKYFFLKTRRNKKFKDLSGKFKFYSTTLG